VALKFSRTTNVFYIEADFIPNRMLHNSTEVTQAKKHLKNQPKSIFIVPGFLTESKVLSSVDSNLEESFPQTKQQLIPLLGEGKDKIIPLAKIFLSHRAFPYDKWRDLSNIVPLSGSPAGFEPYYISTRDYPLFDEIMIGCGQDKIVHFQELMKAGYSVYILPNHFIVHLDSTGMGAAWCRNQQVRFPKSAAFNKRIAEQYGEGATNDNLVWWDQAKTGSSQLNPPTVKITSAPMLATQSSTQSNIESRIAALTAEIQEIERNLALVETYQVRFVVGVAVIILMIFFAIINFSAMRARRLQRKH